MNFLNDIKSKVGEKVDDAKEATGVVGEAAGKVADKVGGAVDAVATGVEDVLPDAVKEWRDEKIRMIKEFKEEKEREFKALIQKKLEKMYDHVMNVVQEHFKESIKDPYMPDCVATTVDEFVDSFWPDVKMEVKDVLLSGVTPAPMIDHGEKPGCPKNFAAAVRYALFPYDRSIWRKMRNPFFWLFVICSLIPKYGIAQITYIILFFFMDCDDEFQMFQYIVDFKALQFVTLGIMSAIVGSTQYYICVSQENCGNQHSTPQEELWSIAVFFVQVFFVWLAFIMLSKAKKKGGAHYMLTQEAKAAERATVASAAARREQLTRLGNTDTSTEVLNTLQLESEEELLVRTRKRMRGYLFYDLMCFLVCLALGLWMAFDNRLDDDAEVDINDGDTIDSQSNWKFAMSLFWIKALYGALSFPFAILKFPLINSFISHARPTGYNPYGNTVPLLNVEEDGPVPWDPTRKSKAELEAEQAV